MSRGPRQGTAGSGQPSARARASLLEYAASLLPAGQAEDATARLLERVAIEFGAEGALVLTPGSAGPLGEHAVYPREISNDVVLLSQLRSAWAEHGGRAASSGHAFQVDLDSGQHRVGLLVAPAEPVLGRRPCALALLGDVARWKPAARTTLKALATMMASLLDVGAVAPPRAEERPWPDWASGEQARPEGDRPGLRLIRPGLQFPSPHSAGVQPPAAGAPNRPPPALPPGARGRAVPPARGGPASPAARPARHPARSAVSARTSRGDQLPEPAGGFPLDTGLVASALVAGAPAAIVAVDSSRRIREFNPAAEELFGRSRAEALGLDMPEALVPERYRQMFVDAMAGYLATGDTTAVTQKVRLRALRADGTERPIELTPMPVTVAGETYFFGFIRDASDVESAGLAVAEGDARFRLLSDLAPVGIMQTDIAGVCSFVNDKWCEMSGMAAAEVIGRNWRSTINASDVKRIDAIRGKAATGPEVATDCRLQDRLGPGDLGARRGPPGPGPVRQPGRPGSGADRRQRAQAHRGRAGAGPAPPGRAERRAARPQRDPGALPGDGLARAAHAADLDRLLLRADPLGGRQARRRTPRSTWTSSSATPSGCCGWSATCWISAAWRRASPGWTWRRSRCRC